MAERLPRTQQTVRIPLIGSTNLRATSTSKDQRYVNVFAETIQNAITGHKSLWCIKRPGLTQFSNPPGTTATGRGIYSWDGNLYSVFGDQLYRNTSSIQTLGTSSGIVCFAETSAIAATPYLFVNDGSKGYVVTTAGTVAEVTDADYNDTNLGNVVFFDGYTLVATSNGRIWNSANEDPTSWGASDFLNAQMYPDGLVAIVRQGTYLVALGQASTEFFYDNAGTSPGSFMAKTDQVALQVGCAGRDTVVQQENFLIWVARSNLGGYSVQKLDGLSNLNKISNSAIDRVLNSEETNISGAYAFAIRTGGHLFYVLTLPNADRTFVFDLDENNWTEWQSSTSGRFLYVASTQHNGIPMIQGASDGKVWEVDQGVYQDGSTAISVIIQTGLIDADTTQRKFCGRLELVGDEQTSASSVSVQYTNDDYQTLSTARTIDLSDSRPVLNHLGSFRRRGYKLTHTADTPLRLEALEMDLTLGSH